MKDSTKDFLKVLLGVFIGLLITYGLCVNCMMPIDCCSTVKPDNNEEEDFTVQDPNAGDTIDYKNVDKYRSNYKRQFIRAEQNGAYGYEGGKISIYAMLKVIGSANEDDKYINFRIGYDSTETTTHDGSVFKSKLFTMFSIGDLNTATNTYPVWINSGDSYCPTQCD